MSLAYAASTQSEPFPSSEPLESRERIDGRRSISTTTTRTGGTLHLTCDINLDMDHNFAGMGGASVFSSVAGGVGGGDGGGPFWPPADDGGVYSTTKQPTAPVTGYIAEGGGFVRGSAPTSPRAAMAFAEAALSASYCSVASEDLFGGGGEASQSRDAQQLRMHPVYDAYPPASSASWSGDRSRNWIMGDSHTYPRLHNEPWPATADRGLDGNREERLQKAVGVDGGGAGRGDGVLLRRQVAEIHALEQELLDLDRNAKRVRRTMAPSLHAAHGMAFPPWRNELGQMLQDNGTRADEAAKSVPAAPPTGGHDLARVPVHGPPGRPATAVRRRRRGAATRKDTSPSPQTVVYKAEGEHQGLARKKRYEGGLQPSRGAEPSGFEAGAKTPKVGKRGTGNRCQHPGCSRGSTFGLRGGGRKPTHCAMHRGEDMVKISSRQCAEEDCSTAPSYGLEGQKATVCSRHRAPGMVNVVTPRCQRDGCTSCASYGHVAERRPVFCARHAQSGMINVVSRKCLHSGCLKNPSYGHPGDRRASFCVDHQQEGMSNIVTVKCLAPGCGKAPSFGKRGDLKATWCKAHKQDGTINIMYSRQLKKAAS
eukprot:g10199.t1